MSILNESGLLGQLDSRHGTSFHDGSETDSHGTTTITLELWKQADEEKEQLFDLMEKVHNRLNKKSSVRQPSTNLRCCKWEEVMNEAQSIAKRRQADSSKVSNMIQCINKVGRHSLAFQSWLGLLPAGDYGSSICGAFKLVIEAAGQFAKVEEAILDVLTDIPEALEDARDYIRIYSDQRDQTLERCTFDLFRTVLRTLTYVMQFYADSSARKVFEPMLKQSSYKKELIQSLSEVKKKVTRIKDEADKCLARRVFEQESRLLHTRDTSEQGLVLLKSIYDHLLNGRDAERIRVIQPSIERGNGPTLVNLTSPTDETSQDTSSIRGDQQNSQYLLRLLQFDENLLPIDTAACLRLGGLLDERAKARAAALVCNTKFRTKMTGENISSALLVNGHEDLGSSEGLSSLSLVAAKLAVLAEATGSAFVVKHFAGQHRPGLDYNVASSAVGVVSSIVCQLLSQMMDRGIAVNLAFLTKADWKHVEKRNLSILCIIFRELTNQLPPQSILFCIIDEISLYETSKLNPETDAVMRRLTRLVRNHDTLTFKLLVTCRGRALGITKYFAGDVVDLGEDIELDDMSTWHLAVMKGL